MPTPTALGGSNFSLPTCPTPQTMLADSHPTPKPTSNTAQTPTLQKKPNIFRNYCTFKEPPEHQELLPAPTQHHGSLCMPGAAPKAPPQTVLPPPAGSDPKTTHPTPQAGHKAPRGPNCRDPGGPSEPPAPHRGWLCSPTRLRTRSRDSAALASSAQPHRCRQQKAQQRLFVIQTSRVGPRALAKEA